MKFLYSFFLIFFSYQTVFAQSILTPEKTTEDGNGGVLNQIEMSEGEGTTETIRQSQDERRLENENNGIEEYSEDIYDEEEGW